MIKKATFLIMIASSLFAPFLRGELVETNEIAVVQEYIVPDTLVFFNLTDTLYIPIATVATGDWKEYFTERVKKIVPDEKNAQKVINKVKNTLQNIPKKPVEESTPSLIAQLQERKIPVLGLTKKQMTTAYEEHFDQVTRNHLKSVGIDFEKTSAYFKVSAENANFKYGILFANKQPIDTVVASLISSLPQQPLQVIAVDNSKKTLTVLENAFANTPIKFVGLRYGRCDASKKDLNPTIGTIQLFFLAAGTALPSHVGMPTQHYGLISDEDALNIMQNTKNTDWEALLDKLIECFLD